MAKVLTSDDERVLYSGHTHPKALFGPVVAGVIVLIVFAVCVWGLEHASAHWLTVDVPIALAVVAVLLLVWFVGRPVLRWSTTRFTLTTRRVESSWGVFAKDSRQLDLHQIVSTESERGILDRLVGCGTIVLYDAAQVPLRFVDVPHFRQLSKQIEKARLALVQHDDGQQ